MNAGGCPAGVQNAGGDLVCAMPSQVGSTAAPQNYSSSSGNTYGFPPAPPASYGAFGTGPQPPATSTYAPHYAPVPGPRYAAPSYNGYGAYTYNPYGAHTYNPYAGYPPPNPYVAPSAIRAAQPPY